MVTSCVSISGTLTAILLLAGCAAGPLRNSQGNPGYRTFVLPPARAAAPLPQLPEPPELATSQEAGGPVTPEVAGSLHLSRIARPTDTEFLVNEALLHMENGKRALEQNRPSGARTEFDRAIEVLVSNSAPDDSADREWLEDQLNELAAEIYRLDRDQLSQAGARTLPPAGDPSLPQLTFPIDPGERSRVQDQIQVRLSEFLMPMNDAVSEYIDFFSAGEGRKIVASGIRSAGRYKEMIQRIFVEEGIPPALVYLAQAESKFDPTAVSFRHCCVGLWQFSADRGPEYGLERSKLVDERRDPELSTRAVAKHLRDLYLHYGDWHLALAAHNCGPGCIDNAIFRTGYADYWELRRLRAIPRETANFVPEIIAFATLSDHPERYGLDDVEQYPTIEYETLELSSPTHLEMAAGAVGVSTEELHRLNPALLKDTAPPGYHLHVPVGTLDSLRQAFAVVPPHRRESWRAHRVRSGDTFASLAAEYKAKADRIESANFGRMPEPGSFAAIPGN